MCIKNHPSFRVLCRVFGNIVPNDIVECKNNWRLTWQVPAGEATPTAAEIEAAVKAVEGVEKVTLRQQYSKPLFCVVNLA